MFSFASLVFGQGMTFSGDCCMLGDIPARPFSGFSLLLRRSAVGSLLAGCAFTFLELLHVASSPLVPFSTQVAIIITLAIRIRPYLFPSLPFIFPFSESHLIDLSSSTSLFIFSLFSGGDFVQHCTNHHISPQLRSPSPSSLNNNNGVCVTWRVAVGVVVMPYMLSQCFLHTGAMEDPLHIGAHLHHIIHSVCERSVCMRVSSNAFVCSL